MVKSLNFLVYWENKNDPPKSNWTLIVDATLEKTAYLPAKSEKKLSDDCSQGEKKCPTDS